VVPEKSVNVIGMPKSPEHVEVKHRNINFNEVTISIKLPDPVWTDPSVKSFRRLKLQASRLDSYPSGRTYEGHGIL
jgi:hypothetical protein